MSLVKFGFVQVGEWSLYPYINSGITFSLSNEIFNEQRVIYAFTVEDVVKYIGVCQENHTTLGERMKRYKHWQGAGTNKRVAKKIKNYLEQKQCVYILAHKPETAHDYNGITVDLIKGLEYPLIQIFQPEWNRHGG